MMDMMTDGMAGMAGMAVWMLVWAVLAVGLLAAGIGWLIRQRGRGARRALEPQGQNTPLEILRHRYATGEIDEDEYLQRLSGISQS